MVFRGDGQLEHYNTLLLSIQGQLNNLGIIYAATVDTGIVSCLYHLSHVEEYHIEALSYRIHHPLAHKHQSR